MQKRLFDYFIVALKGVAMGAADVVPGVSGGTIAIISGIYQQLIESIDHLGIDTIKVWRKKGFKKAWKFINGNFLLALFLGIALSIFSLAKIIKWLYVNETVLLWSFFFGLVLASIIYIGKQVTSWNITIIIAATVTSVISYFLTTIEPFTSPDSNLYLLFCGFIAIIAMILPGVSGAFILLILGAYDTALGIVNDLRESITTLDFELFKQTFIKFLMFAIGATLGIKIFSKILNWMFKNYKNLTLSILIGFMIGSLNKIWPWKKTLSTRINSDGIEVPFLEQSISPFNFQGDNKFLFAIILIITGFLTIIILERLSKKVET